MGSERRGKIYSSVCNGAVVSITESLYEITNVRGNYRELDPMYQLIVGLNSLKQEW